MSWNILLVDDEPAITNAIRRMLRAESWHILQADNARTALTILQQQDIHVLVTDYKMPGTDGLTLCRQARQHSPDTYRLLLSGQVDYADLRQAWKQGDVHRFVAKPWDNLLLRLDITEGIRRHQLLRRSNDLMQRLNQQNALLLTDQNWIVRYVSPALADLLQCRDQSLLGINLFAPAVSDAAVTLETEVTWQTEQEQTWLGDFSFHCADGSLLPVRMSISPLGSDFRVICCEPLTADTAPQRELNDELQRYSGEHHLQRLQEDAGQADAELRLLVVEFPAHSIANRDIAAVCFERLQEACAGEFPVYSPQLNIFLLLLPASLTATGIRQLQQRIQEAFSAPLDQQSLQPLISPERKPADIDCWTDWLRQRLGIPAHRPSPTGTPAAAAAADGHNAPPQDTATPVFNQTGQLTALQTPPPPQFDRDGWRHWLQQAQQEWQALSRAPLSLLIPAVDCHAAQLQPLLQALADTADANRQLCALVHEAEILAGQKDDNTGLCALLTSAGCRLMLEDFGRGFVSPRQLLTLPLAGISLSADFLQQLQHTRSLAQNRRLLQRLHEQGLQIRAAGLDSPELLAAAHSSQVDWLVGELLSPPISLRQLSWFGTGSGA